MARRRSKAPNPTEGFDRFIKLKNGRTLTEGDEFTVSPRCATEATGEPVATGSCTSAPRAT